MGDLPGKMTQTNQRTPGIVREMIFLPLTAGILGFFLVLSLTWPAGRRELSLDDLVHFQLNPAQNVSLSLWQIARLRHWQHDPADGTWRPVPKLLWTALWRVGDGRTLPFAFMTAVLAGVCAGLFGVCLMRGRGPSAPAPLVLLAAVAPLLNPLSADVILPFVGQAELLAAAGTLGAWICWRRPGIRSGMRFAGGCLFLASAILSKEGAYPAAVVVPLAIWFGEGGRPMRRRLAARAFAAAFALIVLRLSLQTYVLGGFQPISGHGGGWFAPGERRVGFMEITGRYAAGFLFPAIPQTDYSFLKQAGSRAGAYPWIGALAFCIALALLAALLWRARANRANARSLRARREAAAALLWMPLFLSPFLQIIPFGALWAGRFAFIPLFGFVWLIFVAGTAAAAPGSPASGKDGTPWAKARTAAAYMPVVYLVLISVFGAAMISMRSRDFVSPLALWESEVRRQPDHGMAWQNLSVYLYRQGRLADAYVASKRSTELLPTIEHHWVTRGQLARDLGLRDDAAQSFARAREIQTRNKRQ
ncbi:MAG: hypothetical protein WCK47_07575 [bacterium]